MAGKGDTPRPYDPAKWSRNWDWIFRRTREVSPILDAGHRHFPVYSEDLHGWHCADCGAPMRGP